MCDETHPCDYAYPVAPGDVPYWQPGMTLRDYFAGQALAGILTNGATPWSTSVAEVSDHQVAVASYDLADAMIAVRDTQ